MNTLFITAKLEFFYEIDTHNLIKLVRKKL